MDEKVSELRRRLRKARLYSVFYDILRIALMVIAISMVLSSRNIFDLISHAVSMGVLYFGISTAIGTDVKLTKREVENDIVSEALKRGIDIDTVANVIATEKLETLLDMIEK